MIDIFGVIKALPIIFMLHISGHVSAGQEKGFDVTFNPASLSENLVMPVNYYYPPILSAEDKTANKREQEVFKRSKFNYYKKLFNTASNTNAYFAAGGFALQDEGAKRYGEPNIVAANVIHKAGYLLGLQKILYKGNGDFVDIKRFKGTKAKKVMVGSLLLSSVSDILKLNGHLKNQDFIFIVFNNGSPGMKYAIYF